MGLMNDRRVEDRDMKSFEILRWSEYGDGKIRGICFVSLQSLKVIRVATSHTVHSMISKEDYNLFMKNRYLYPYKNIDTGKLYNSDAYVVVGKFIRYTGQTVYTLMGYDEDCIFVVDDEILKYKTLNDKDSIGVSSTSMKYINGTTLRFYDIESNRLVCNSDFSEAAPNVFEKYIDTIEINAINIEDILEASHGVKKVIINAYGFDNRLDGFYLSNELDTVEEIKINGNISIKNLDFRRIFPNLKTFKFCNLTYKECNYRFDFCDTIFSDNIDINYILRLKGNHTIWSEQFLNYDANGRDIIIPKNIHRIQTSCFHNIKNVKKVYILGNQVEFEAKNDKLFLESEYNIELHINKYFTEEIPIGNNVTVIRDIEDEEYELVRGKIAKIKMFTGKGRIDSRTLFSLCSDDCIKNILNLLIVPYTNFNRFRKLFGMETCIKELLLKRYFNLRIYGYESYKIVKVLYTYHYIFIVHTYGIVAVPYSKDILMEAFSYSFDIDPYAYNINLPYMNLHLESIFKNKSIHITYAENYKNGIKIEATCDTNEYSVAVSMNGTKTVASVISMHSIQ